MLETVFSAAFVAALVALIVYVAGKLGYEIPLPAQAVMWLVIATAGYFLGGLIELYPELGPIVQMVIEILIIILSALGLYDIGRAVKKRM